MDSSKNKRAPSTRRIAATSATHNHDVRGRNNDYEDASPQHFPTSTNTANVVGVLGNYQVYRIQVQGKCGTDTADAAAGSAKKENGRLKLGISLVEKEWLNPELRKAFPRSTQLTFVDAIQKNSLAKKAGVHVKDILCWYSGAHHPPVVFHDLQVSSDNNNNNNNNDTTNMWHLIDFQTFQDHVAKYNKDGGDGPFTFYVVRKQRTTEASALEKKSIGGVTVRSSLLTRVRMYESLDARKQEKLLEEIKNDAKNRFEEERNRILHALPYFYKNQFLQIGFVPYRNLYYAVLVISPFHVPPDSTARNHWMEKYHKREEKGTTAKMQYLVQFYGEPDDSNEKYMLVHQKKYVPWLEGKKRKYDQFLSATSQARRVRAHNEMMADLDKTCAERAATRLAPFQELHEKISVDDLLDWSSSSSSDDDDTEHDDNGDAATASVVAESNATTTEEDDRRKPVVADSGRHSLVDVVSLPPPGSLHDTIVDNNQDKDDHRKLEASSSGDNLVGDDAAAPTTGSEAIIEDNKKFAADTNTTTTTFIVKLRKRKIALLDNSETSQDNTSKAASESTAESQPDADQQPAAQNGGGRSLDSSQDGTASSEFPRQGQDADLFFVRSYDQEAGLWSQGFVQEVSILSRKNAARRAEHKQLVQKLKNLRTERLAAIARLERTVSSNRHQRIAAAADVGVDTLLQHEFEAIVPTEDTLMSSISRMTEQNQELFAAITQLKKALKEEEAKKRVLQEWKGFTNVMITKLQS